MDSTNQRSIQQQSIFGTFQILQGQNTDVVNLFDRYQFIRTFDDNGNYVYTLDENNLDLNIQCLQNPSNFEGYVIKSGQLYQTDEIHKDFSNTWDNIINIINDYNYGVMINQNLINITSINYNLITSTNNTYGLLYFDNTNTIYQNKINVENDNLIYCYQSLQNNQKQFLFGSASGLIQSQQYIQNGDIQSIDFNKLTSTIDINQIQDNYITSIKIISLPFSKITNIPQFFLYNGIQKQYITTSDFQSQSIDGDIISNGTISNTKIISLDFSQLTSTIDLNQIQNTYIIYDKLNIQDNEIPQNKLQQFLHYNYGGVDKQFILNSDIQQFEIDYMKLNSQGQEGFLFFVQNSFLPVIQQYIYDENILTVGYDKLILMNQIKNSDINSLANIQQSKLEQYNFFNYNGIDTQYISNIHIQNNSIDGAKLQNTSVTNTQILDVVYNKIVSYDNVFGLLYFDNTNTIYKNKINLENSNLLYLYSSLQNNRKEFIYGDSSGSILSQFQIQNSDIASLQYSKLTSLPNYFIYNGSSQQFIQLNQIDVSTALNDQILQYKTIGGLQFQTLSSLTFPTYFCYSGASKQYVVDSDLQQNTISLNRITPNTAYFLAQTSSDGSVMTHNYLKDQSIQTNTISLNKITPNTAYFIAQTNFNATTMVHNYLQDQSIQTNTISLNKLKNTTNNYSFITSSLSNVVQELRINSNTLFNQYFSSTNSSMIDVNKLNKNSGIGLTERYVMISLLNNRLERIDDIYLYGSLPNFTHQSTPYFVDQNLGIGTFNSISSNPTLNFYKKVGYSGTRIDYCSVLARTDGEIVIIGNNNNGIGCVGFGYSSSPYCNGLTQVSYISRTGSYVISSDKNEKENIQDQDDDEEIQKQCTKIKIKKYNYKHDEYKRIQTGILAQDLQNLSCFQDCIQKTDGLHLDTTQLQMKMFQIIIQQQKKINSQKNTIDELIKTQIRQEQKIEMILQKLKL